MRDYFFEGRIDSGAAVDRHLTPEAYREIHDTTLQVLEQTGILVDDPQTLELFADHGAEVDLKRKIARLSPEMVVGAIHSAPSRIMLAGRSPERDVFIGDNATHFANFSSNINIVDLHSRDVRSATKADLVASARLCDALDQVSIFTRAVYALDTPPNVMHLHTAEACLLNTTKHCFHGPEKAWEMKKIIALAEVAAGGAGRLKDRPLVTFMASVTSPLRLTRTFCQAVTTSAGAGFATGISTMVMGGSTGPVHPAGVMVQTNAEVLAGIVLAQLVKRGAPVIYVSYSTGMDLRFGSAPLGSPETALIASAVAGLCRYYRLPCQVPGLSTDSKQNGYQAAHEKTLTGLMAGRSGANLICGIGGLETGLTFDFGLAVLDDEIVRLVKHLQHGFEVNPTTLSPELIREIGPGGNYLDHPSTFDAMRSVSQPIFLDRSNRETWTKRGSLGSYKKACLRAMEILDRHQPPPLPGADRRLIREIVREAEREAEKDRVHFG